MLTQTFKAVDTLVDVNKFILLNRSGDNTVPYKLMTNFPKKVFAPEDTNKTLAELGKWTLGLHITTCVCVCLLCVCVCVCVPSWCRS